MRKRWRLPVHDAGRILQMEREAGVSSILARLLVQRGFTQPTMVHGFLEAKLTQLREPEELPGALAAAERLVAAVRAQERITVYGDYDADGMTGTAILYGALKLLGADVGYYLPNRLEDGYGLHCDSLRTLAERGTRVVVSVDCGIASITEAETARSLGIDLIITDHHEMREQLPNATALVHPRLPGTAYPFGELCGAGVALKVAWLTCRLAENSGKRVSERLRDYLLSSVGLAALGTVADMVPLVDENRVLVRYGLISLKERAPLGLKALMQVANLTEKTGLGSEDIAFSLAPRINAAGRLGQAQLGVELLTTASADRAQALAEYIHQLNGSRDSLERSIYLAAMKQIKEQFDADHDPAFVLAGRGWHVGVIGIVAGRLAEKLNRPVILIALDQLGVKPGVGSARAANALALHEALSACGERLVSHGGHAAAAGLKIKEECIDAFREEFLEYASAEISEPLREPELVIDAETNFSELTLGGVEELERLAPFGMGNPRPVLCASGVTLTEPPKRMGAGERHLMLKLMQNGAALRGVAFGGGEWCEELTGLNAPLDIAYRPVINEFRGRRSVEVQLVDWRPTACPATTISH